MKKLLIMLLLSGTGTAFAQKTDFTGNFKVNEEKVNWGPAPKFILPRHIKVQQLKDKIIISRTVLNQAMEEQAPVVDTVAFDGAMFTKASTNGNKVTSSLKWTDDKGFVLVRKTLSADGDVLGTTTETWALEDAGKTLFVNREVTGRMNFTTKAYFDKQ